MKNLKNWGGNKSMKNHAFMGLFNKKTKINFEFNTLLNSLNDTLYKGFRLQVLACIPIGF